MATAMTCPPLSFIAQRMGLADPSSSTTRYAVYFKQKSKGKSKRMIWTGLQG